MNQFAQVHSALFSLTLFMGIDLSPHQRGCKCNTAFPFYRFAISHYQLNFLPFILAYRKKTSFTMIKWTVVLGFFESATYVFQSIGLETVSSANSEFLTDFSVVVVSFLTLVFLRKKLQWFDFSAALLCLVGIFIPIDADVFTLTSGGDFWALACAFSYSCYIVALQAFSKKIKRKDTTLALSYKIAFSLFLFLLTFSYENMGIIFSWSVVIPVLFFSIFVTCLVFYLQFWYQRCVSMRKAVLIYAFEPIFF
ncbi:DMT family transporter [Candidatus Coxiella mudrowiae]|uniref:DMT family transporter n=1 Tax=Candidatus Coxiella mudrowiae TaxID=2054173 RepID=UPI001FD1D006|nr:DMT family transporter [Candidatus Coxiella mudrowiae]